MINTTQLNLRRAFTYADLIVLGVVFVAVFGCLLPMAIANRARPAAMQSGCAGNLRALGQSLLLYANMERNGSFPRTLADTSGRAILTNQGCDSADAFDVRVGTNNIPASLFLLLKTQDISSEVFTCPNVERERDTFGGGTNNATHRSNFTNIDLNLSYSIQNMFPDETALKSGFKWNNSMSPDFAVMADKSPGQVPGSNVFAPTGPADIARQQRLANSMNHAKDGQNVLFGEGHVEFVASPWVGVNKDNIYTRAGSTAFGPNFSPADANDSFLLPAASRVMDGGLVEGIGTSAWVWGLSLTALAALAGGLVILKKRRRSAKVAKTGRLTPEVR